MDSSTKINAGVPAGLDDAAEMVSGDALDAILRQIVGGYFVLTDGQGSVSKWSEPAELLFGRPATDVLGQSFFDTLVQRPLPPAAEAWRRFLETGEAPTVPGRVEVWGLHAEGSTFPMDTVFVPVKLDEGFDFSLFLEDLGFELPLNLMLQRMRAQHPVVVRALRQALEPEPQPWEGWRTAGTLVVLRPLQATPWVEAELARREAARAEADAEVEERLTTIDPGIQGNSVAELDDAAAVVARLLSAMERIDELERIALGLPAQLEEARQSAERRAESAEREAQILRAEMKRVLGGDEVELLTRLERAEQAAGDRARALEAAETAQAELTARLDRLERERAEHSAAADARLAAALAEAQRRADEAIAAAAARADEARALVEARLAEGASGELATQLERVRAEQEQAAQAARAELAETIERLERERAHDAEAARAELAPLHERAAAIDSLRTEIAGLRHQLDGFGSTIAELEAFRTEVATLQAGAADLAALRDQVAALRDGAAGIEPLREQVADVAALRSRIEELAAGTADLASRLDEVGALAARLDALQGTTAHLQALEARLDGASDRAEVEALRAELGALRAGVEHAEGLRAELAELRRTAAPVEHLEELRRQQELVRTWLDEARRERDEFRAAGERTTAQVEELRRSLEERHDEPTVPAAQAVDRDVVDQMGSQLEMLRNAEQALRMRLADTIAAGEVATRRIDHLAEVGEAIERRIEDMEASTGVRLDEVAAGAETARGEARSAAETAAQAVQEIRAEVRTAAEAVEVLRGDVRAAVETADATRGEAVAAVEEVRREACAASEAVEDVRGEAACAVAAAQESHAEARRASDCADGARADAARAAAGVAELQHRIDEVDRGAGSVLADVRTLRDRLDELSDIARTAQETATGSRTDAEELRGALASLGGEVEAGTQRLDTLGAEVKAGAERIDALGAELEKAATAAKSAGERNAERLTDVEAAANVLRTDVTAGTERLEAISDRVERLAEDVVGAGALEAQGAELAAVRRLAEEARDGLESLRHDVEAVREQSQSVREDAAGARLAAEAGERRVEAMQAELAYALKTLEDVKAGLTSAGQAAVIARREAEQAKRAAQQTQTDGSSGVHEVFQQLLAAARGGGPSDAPRLRRPHTPAQDLRRKSEAHNREPRHGFDDIPQPQAILGLDGRFRELNPAFARLVGYQEHAFVKAAWPSPHDRAGYQQQQEQLRQLASGEIESVDVQSTYMHGQGLMVPVVGTLRAVPGEDGRPLHLLLEAEDRHSG